MGRISRDKPIDNWKASETRNLLSSVYKGKELELEQEIPL